MRVLKGLAWSICVAVIVLVMAFAWGRLRGPSEQQAAAMKFFAQDMRPAKGRNAFPAMWFGDYDVPADQVDALYRQERVDISRWLATARYDGKNFPSFVSSLTANYAKVPRLSEEDKALTCSLESKDCLATVRDHRDQVAALLVRNAARLAREKAYGTYDFSWDDLPRDVFAPFPSYGTTNSLWLTAAALEFVNGDATSALQQVCTNALAQRRMHAHSNTTIDIFLAMFRLKTAASVFLQMLAALPLDQPLPDTCNQAFAHVDEKDVDLGASMQSDFQTTVAISRQSLAVSRKNQPVEWFAQLAYSPTVMLRQAAVRNAWMCSDAVAAQVLEDHLFSVEDFPRLADPFDWLSNASGSVLSAIAQPVYINNLNRQADGVAVLRLVATVLWLRQTHGNGLPLAERLQQRPAWMLIAGDRHFGLSKDGRRLHMDYHYPRKNGVEMTEWPLAVGI